MKKNQRFNGIKEGYWEIYYNDGKLWYRGNYKNNICDGYWEYYWSNRKLHSKGHYINGEKVGYWEEYYFNNGELYLMEYFVI